MDYLAEEAAYTGNEVTPTVGQISFGVLKVAGLVRVSDELLADSVPNLPALLSQIFQSANGRFQDKEILAGNGTNRYNGIVNGTDGAGASVGYSTLANATSVVAADIVDAYFDVPQQHRGVDSFRWVFPSAISALINGIGTTAAGVHAIDSLVNAPDAFLMGRQVLNVDVTGQPFGTTITSTEKIGLAGNMSAYYIFERAGISIRRNDSLYMGNGQVGFFATSRSDGRMATAEAFKILRAA
jgi:HK97 family phage major capsid protein